MLYPPLLYQFSVKFCCCLYWTFSISIITLPLSDSVMVVHIFSHHHFPVTLPPKFPLLCASDYYIILNICFWHLHYICTSAKTVSLLSMSMINTYIYSPIYLTLLWFHRLNHSTYLPLPSLKSHVSTAILILSIFPLTFYLYPFHHNFLGLTPYISSLKNQNIFSIYWFFLLSLDFFSFTYFVIDPYW